MRKVKSCGILLMTEREPRSFLLMRHVDRWDLPKGHVDRGETDLECALREFEEETGISRESISVDPGFLYRDVYKVPEKRSGKQVEKTLLIYLAMVPAECQVELSEHIGYEWRKWAPPHAIQARTIDPLLRYLERFLAEIEVGRSAALGGQP
jgi:8-oxo-dGTP pyrophosphatase MutT (NUDIX family)